LKEEGRERGSVDVKRGFKRWVVWRWKFKGGVRIIEEQARWKGRRPEYVTPCVFFVS
jgi:hypothetical protein